jgi:hypothetical protein
VTAGHVVLNVGYRTALLLTVCLVTLTYLVPVAGAAHVGIDPSGWTTGSWVSAGDIVGGRGLALAIGVGGMLCGLSAWRMRWSCRIRVCRWCSP